MTGLSSTSQSMKQVLFIAYQYPPFGGAGVQRTLKFTKYLPATSWSPVVLTVDAKYAPQQDPSLLDEIPCTVLVKHTPALLPPRQLPFRVRNLLSRWVLLTDEQLGWYPFAVSQGRSLIKKQNIAAIYSTSSPYTNHLIGYSLHKTSRLPWVVDLRDPWVGNFDRRYPTRLHERLDRKLERMVIDHAQRVIVVSPPMKVDLLDRYRDLSPEKIVVITNGYDSSDFKHIHPVQYPRGQFTITYTGTFYSNSRSPQSFLTALQLAISSGQIPHSRIQVYLVGNLGRLAEDMVRSSNLADIIQTTGYLSHQQSVAHLVNANLLLLVIGTSKNSQTVFTGKIFEYLAVKRPILALVPPGPAADLIREAHAGEIVDPDDPKQIADRLSKMYDLWTRGELVIEPRPQIIERYERKNLTMALASVLDEITN